MASAFEGERFLNAVAVNGSGTATHYTVPASRYTKFYIQRLELPNSASSITLGAIVINNTGVNTYIGPLGYPPSGFNKYEQFIEIVLTAGQTISSVSATAVQGTALEFEDKNL
jgi:hypothetical protein